MLAGDLRRVVMGVAVAVFAVSCAGGDGSSHSALSRGDVDCDADALGSDELFSILMGDQVEPRRNFIQQHALQVQNLDI